MIIEKNSNTRERERICVCAHSRNDAFFPFFVLQDATDSIRVARASVRDSSAAVASAGQAATIVQVETISIGGPQSRETNFHPVRCHHHVSLDCIFMLAMSFT